MVLLSDKHPIDLTIGQELPPTFHYAWVILHDLPPDRDGEPFQRVRQTRGVAYWDDPQGPDARVIAVVGSYLVAVNAETGARYPDFGEGGEVDLTQGYDDRDVDTFAWGSPPIIVNDVVIIGSAITDVTNPTMAAMKEMPPGDVRGFDVRTGEQLWSFHTIPREGEPGNETWLTALDQDRASWEYSGNTNMWAWPAADEELGYVYVPLSTPTNDYYGGYRPGDNLFAEAIVCLDARTGRRVWHFQAVHHGIWDYDFPAAPNVLDIKVDGRTIQAVAAVSKQAFTYVLDRATGEPVWPIEERPVPVGDVPGEWYAATQPFPTKPPPFDQQGTCVDDLIDFTPALRREALEIFNRHVTGSAFHAANPHRGGGDAGHAPDAGCGRWRRLGWRRGRPGDGGALCAVGAQRVGHRSRGVGAPAVEHEHRRAVADRGGGTAGASAVQAPLWSSRGHRPQRRRDSVVGAQRRWSARPSCVARRRAALARSARSCLTAG